MYFVWESEHLNLGYTLDGVERAHNQSDWRSTQLFSSATTC